MNHQDLNNVLTGRNKDRKKYGNNTYLERRGDKIALLYHNTDVVTFEPDGSIVLNSGGWHTPTTKERINWGLSQTGYSLSQDRGVWYLRGENATYRYADGITITPAGVSGADTTTTPTMDRATKRQIRQYAELCRDAVPMDPPGNGDCWFCLMTTEAGGSLGEATKNKDHIQGHMEEKYVVPSLVLRALKQAGNSDMVLSLVFNNPENVMLDLARDRVYRNVYRYISKQLGFAA